ncbi:MAG: LysE family translocator [Paracoccaceae bacterium]
MTVFGVTPDLLAAFALTSTVIELTPGPNMTYLAVVALSEGRRSGFAAVAGVALGLGLVGLAAALGLAAVINASPFLYQSLRWVGAAYLLWLAWDGWRGAAEPSDGLQPGTTLARYFRRGLITNLLNPKAAVFYVAVLPTFLRPDAPLTAQAITLAAVYVAVATAIHASIVALAGTARSWLEDARLTGIARRVLALALAAVALWFLAKT